MTDADSFRATTRNGRRAGSTTLVTHLLVDETVGDNSLPIVIGPMSADAAIQLVDDREQDALLRFEQLKSEIVERSTNGHVLYQHDGEM